MLDCDIVTCHTPLTFDGPDPTYRLIGETFFDRLKPGAWFCSAGRGEVVHEAALHKALDEQCLDAVVLDVWDHEPEIDGRLLARVDIGTPHIAGYSLEGKLNGTAIIYRAACAFLGVEPAWSAEAAVPPRPAGLPLRGFGDGDESLAQLDTHGLAALADTVTASMRHPSRRRSAEEDRRDERGGAGQGLRPAAQDLPRPPRVHASGVLFSESCR